MEDKAQFRLRFRTHEESASPNMGDNKPPSSSPPSRASQDPNRRNTQHPNTQQKHNRNTTTNSQPTRVQTRYRNPHIALSHATAPASRRPGGRRGWWWVRLQEIASTGVQCLWRFARASAREVETTRRYGRDVLEEKCPACTLALINYPSKV